MAQDVIIQVGADPEKARYHRGALTGKELLSPEQCNIDSAAHVEQRARLPLAVTATQLCQRCFGSSGSPEPTVAAVQLAERGADATLAAGDAPDEQTQAVILSRQAEAQDAELATERTDG